MPIRTVEVAGAPIEMGRQYGEELRQEAREMIGTRLELAAKAAEALNPPRDIQWCLDLAAETFPALESYPGTVFDELEGISQATGLDLLELIIGNGWTDFRDLMGVRDQPHNCTSLVVGPKFSADGHVYLAQTWDMNVSAAPYVVLVRRQPTDGPRTISLTTAGCLSLVGINEHGIAVGNTNLVPTDARPGVFYLAIIHEALRQSSIDDAVTAIASGHRMSGHYYYVGEPNDTFSGLETAAIAFDEVAWSQRHYAHTNHYESGRLMESGVTTAAGANSVGRKERCDGLLSAHEGGITVTDISQILGDHEGEHPICRHADPGAEYATLASAIMCPAERRMWVSTGQPCTSPLEPVGF